MFITVFVKRSVILNDIDKQTGNKTDRDTHKGTQTVARVVGSVCPQPKGTF